MPDPIILGKVTVTPRGTWNSLNAYARLDVVSYEGSSYIAKQDVPAGTVLSDTQYWQTIALKGETGDAFQIVKTYASISEMNADYSGTDVKIGEFVIISSDVEDPDNAKVYVKGAEAYTFVTDMSGATGIQGPKGDTGDSGVYVGSTEPTDPDQVVWIDPTGTGTSIEDVKNEIKDITEETNYFWFTNRVPRTVVQSVDGVDTEIATLEFLDKSTIRINSIIDDITGNRRAFVKEVNMFSRGDTDKYGTNLPSGTYIHTRNRISGEALGTAMGNLRVGSSLSSWNPNAARTFDADTVICFRIPSGGIYNNAVYQINVSKGTVLQAYTEGGLHSNDILAKAQIAETNNVIEEVRNTRSIFGQDDLEQGGFTTATGIQDSTKRIRTKKLIRAIKGSRISFSIGPLYSMIWELSTESKSGNNVFNARGWARETEYLVRNDCWLMIAFATAATSSASSDISVYDFLKAGTSASGTSDPTQTVTYYYQITPDSSDIGAWDDYHNYNNQTVTDKIAEYSGLIQSASGTDIESFLFFTDSHIAGGLYWQQNLRTHLLRISGVYHTAPVDFALFGGDAITNDSDYDSSITPSNAVYYLTCQDQMCREIFGKDYYSLVGNHDYNYFGTAQLTETQIANAMHRKTQKAYYSIKGNNTTIYALNTGLNRVGTDYDVPMDEYKWAQIDWLANSLIEDDSDHSIIAMHIIRNNNTNQPEFALFTNANELAAAYNEHTTITLNSQTYDFSGCNGKVEMFLGGHLHNDGYNIVKNSIPCIMRANATHDNVNPTFDLVLCDWNSRIVYFKRFGDGFDLTVDLDNYDPS